MNLANCFPKSEYLHTNHILYKSTQTKYSRVTYQGVREKHAFQKQEPQEESKTNIKKQRK